MKFSKNDLRQLNNEEGVAMHVQRMTGHELALPARSTEGAAGFDLRAAELTVIEPGDRALIKTGFAWNIPNGCAGFVCPRSGLALKHGVTVLNAPGVVDSDYRGEVGVILQNHGREPFIVNVGDRIAQMVVVRLAPFGHVLEVGALDETERGDGGFGHTGTE